jgi:hypothetical protein
LKFLAFTANVKTRQQNVKKKKFSKPRTEKKSPRRKKYQKVKKALRKMWDKISKNPTTPKKPF